MRDNIVILETIEIKLNEVAKEYVSGLSLRESVLTINDAISLSVELLDESEQSHEVVHAHIIAKLLLQDKEEILEACVLGFGENRNKSIKNCGENWVDFVSAPMLSLLNAKPVLNANHFDEDDDYGVADCHGFVGLLIGRGVEDAYDLVSLQNEDLFKFVSEIAPPGRIHICKLVLRGENGKWIRNIEINGHGTIYFDSPQYEILPPENGYITSYAIFHYFGDDKHIESRQKVDDAIKLFIDIMFDFEGDMDKAFSALIENGYSPMLANSICCFTPTAFGRSLVSGLGITFDDNYIRLSTIENKKMELMSHAVFARSTVFAEIVKLEEPEKYKLLALCSSIVNMINDSLNQGANPEDLKTASTILTDPNMTENETHIALNKVIQELKRTS
ncbi:MAG: hypothetical protein NE327_21725 [Lentisphaeraceae bacterium]|nr:hypothetical protein [Lentisphaeraceae bacterium]